MSFEPSPEQLESASAAKESSPEPTLLRIGALDGLRGVEIALVPTDHTWNLQGTPFDRRAEFFPSAGPSGVYASSTLIKR